MWVLCGLVLPSSEGALEASDEEGTAVGFGLRDSTQEMRLWG